MRTANACDLPTRLAGIRRRLDRWRRTRKGHSRIPEGLWALAVKAAGKYGLNPTARALRLDYYSLKTRVEAAGACRVAGEKVASEFISGRQAIPADDQTMTTFVELAPPMSSGSRECILELEDPGGAKMRVHLKGVEAPDLAALSRSFWGMES